MIDDEKIKEIVSRIVDAVKPEKIILFGSYAYGKPAKSSDIDLCVIVDDKSDNFDSIEDKIRDNLEDTLVPMDIIVYNNQMIDEWNGIKMSFPDIITRKGKILYESN